jgi:hypothetical protein
MGQKFKFDFGKVEEQIKKQDEKKDYTDNRFWKLTPDESGNAMAIIRFIPDKNGNPFVKYYAHSFEYNDNGTKKWYIENCVSTFGFDRKCPICEKNQEYWNSAFEKDKEIASIRKRKLFYVANIHVIKNPNNPEQEGSTFLFKFGPKIYEKIKAKWFPSATDLADPDFVQFIPFDLYEGANFKLKGINLNTKQNKRGVYPNYDTSEFSPQSKFLGGDDKKIEKVIEETNVLDEFVDESKFPTNDHVKKVLASILGGTAQVKEEKDVPSFDSDDDIPDFSSKESLPFKTDDEEIDDDDAFFEDLKK